MVASFIVTLAQQESDHQSKSLRTKGRLTFLRNFRSRSAC